MTSASKCVGLSRRLDRHPIGTMTVKEAEEILRRQGFRPATAAERKRNKKFLRASA